MRPNKAQLKGVAPEQHGERLAIVALASKTNRLATALQVPIDPAFDLGAPRASGSTPRGTRRSPRCE